MEYGNTKGHTNPQLVLESAWRVPNWGAMKEALAQVRRMHDGRQTDVQVKDTLAHMNKKKITVGEQYSLLYS